MPTVPVDATPFWLVATVAITCLLLVAYVVHAVVGKINPTLVALPGLMKDAVKEGFSEARRESDQACAATAHR
jgi:hypothetical protein